MWKLKGGFWEDVLQECFLLDQYFLNIFSFFPICGGVHFCLHRLVMLAKNPLLRPRIHWRGSPRLNTKSWSWVGGLDVRHIMTCQSDASHRQRILWIECVSTTWYEDHFLAELVECRLKGCLCSITLWGALARFSRGLWHFWEQDGPYYHLVTAIFDSDILTHPAGCC